MLLELLPTATPEPWMATRTAIGIAADVSAPPGPGSHPAASEIPAAVIGVAVAVDRSGVERVDRRPRPPGQPVPVLVQPALQPGLHVAEPDAAVTLHRQARSGRRRRNPRRRRAAAAGSHHKRVPRRTVVRRARALGCRCPALCIAVG